ncbi:hypothetical protein B0H19DRAFT_1073990 [Mycena capillaripes]|nr:hypothetical protein B0H19DRAFT_1073990 [Mycena capillaripes]
MLFAPLTLVLAAFAFVLTPAAGTPAPTGISDPCNSCHTESSPGHPGVEALQSMLKRTSDISLGLKSTIMATTAVPMKASTEVDLDHLYVKEVRGIWTVKADFDAAVQVEQAELWQPKRELGFARKSDSGIAFAGPMSTRRKAN